MPSPRLAVTGAAEFFLLLPGASTPVFFGTAIGKPKIIGQPGQTPIYNDLGGNVPFDFQYNGQIAVVSAVFNRIDQSLMRLLRTAPRYNLTTSKFGAGGLVEGQQGGYEQGAVMVQDGWCPGLFIRYPYFGSAPATAAGVPAGKYFPAAFWGPQDEDEVGSEVEECAGVFTCPRVWTAPAVVTNPVGTFTLWSSDPAAFANLPQIS